MAETDSPPSDYAVGHGFGATVPSARYDGLALFKRSVTAACPWSYQHAWEHVRSGGSLPFLVVEGSDSTVHTLRADGASFRPSRFAGKDIALWSVPFKTRQLGTL